MKMKPQRWLLWLAVLLVAGAAHAQDETLAPGLYYYFHPSTGTKELYYHGDRSSMPNDPLAVEAKPLPVKHLPKALGLPETQSTNAPTSMPAPAQRRPTAAKPAQYKKPAQHKKPSQTKPQIKKKPLSPSISKPPVVFTPSAPPPPFMEEIRTPPVIPTSRPVRTTPIVPYTPRRSRPVLTPGYQPRTFYQPLRRSSSIPARGNLYIGEGDDRSIEENEDGILQLDDGSVWEVSPLGRVDSDLWLAPDEVKVIYIGGLYPYKIINTHERESVEARLLRQ